MRDRIRICFIVLSEVLSMIRIKVQYLPTFICMVVLIISGFCLLNYENLNDLSSPIVNIIGGIFMIVGFIPLLEFRKKKK
jgi:hypothetical protein